MKKPNNYSILYDEINKIYQTDKKITPQKILNLAKDKNHPLHNYFEWNDAVAADKWRLEQARELIRKIIIRVMCDNSKEIKVRAFLNVNESNGDLVINGNKNTDNYYVSVEDIKKDEKLIQYQLLKAKSELKAFHNKYEFLHLYLEPIFKEIDNL